MKRLLFVLLILFTPMVVLADSVSPQIFGFDAVIINKNGVKVDLYEGKKTIPYNTKISVVNEYDDGLYACLKSNADDCFTISAKDVAPLKEEVLPKDLLKKDYDGTTLDEYKSNIFIYNSNGLKLRKGPSDAYGTYSNPVPFKSIVKVVYGVHFEGHGGGYTWFYVNDGDYKGWVSDDEIGLYSNLGIMTFKDTKFYDVETKQEVATIPAETEIKETYYGNKVYFSYKDNYGYIDTSEYNISYRVSSYGYKSLLGYIFTMESVEMLNNDLKAITAIPKGERIKILYADIEDDDSFDYPWHETRPICVNEDTCLYYIDFNGTKGFVNSKDVLALYHEDKVVNKNFDHELKLYDTKYLSNSGRLDEEKISLEKYSKEHETGITIPANTKVTSYMEYYLDDSSMDEHVIDGTRQYTINLVKYKNNIGWIVSDENDSRVFTEETIEQRDSEQPTTNPVKDKTLESIMNGIMIALIASSLALALIFIVNKKSKIKNEG